MCFDKLIKREPEKNKGLEILLKVFLVIGIIAGICVIMKFVYEKCLRNRFCFCGDEYENDEGDYCCDDECDCDECTGDISGHADVINDSDN